MRGLLVTGRLACGVLGLALLGGCSVGEPATGATPATTPPTTPAPSSLPAPTPAVPPRSATPAPLPAPPPETRTSSAAVSTRPAVPIGQPAELLPDVAVRVVAVRQVRLGARGPGEIAGSGVTVQLRVENGSARTVDLDALAVTASYGGAVPAPPASDGAEAMAGGLAAGATAGGTYAFALPPSGVASLVVEVSSGQSPYVLRFAR